MTVHYFLITGKPVETVRERLIEQALERDPEYILFVDDDVILNRDAVQRLVYSLKNAGSDVAVMSGIYVTKADFPEPLVFRRNGGGASWDWKFGDVFEVEGVGAGCMLIRADVFKHLPKPWFSWTNEEAPDNQEHRVTTGEDIYFCQKVRDAGFKVMADGGVLCLHFDPVKNRYYHLPDDSYPMRKEIHNSIAP